MQFSFEPIPQNGIVLILVVSALMLSSLVSSISDAQYCKVGLTCGPSQPFQDQLVKNFGALMDSISYKVNEQGWGTDSVVITNPNVMYALGECHRNLNRTECSDCFVKARQCLRTCLPAVSGRMHMDGCFLRYDDYSFFSESVNPNIDKSVCGLPTYEASEKDEIMDASSFKQVARVILNVTREGGKHKFAVASEEEGKHVYALAQCWTVLDEAACYTCLMGAGKHVLSCAPSVEGRGLYTGCYLRYSTNKFYGDAGETSAKNAVDTPRVRMILVGVLSSVVVVLLIVLGVILSWKKKKKAIASSRKDSHNFGRMPGLGDKTGLFFRYELLEKATEFFDPSRKLGQGGAGSVFKGTLSTGRDVAVKRLFFNTRQWADEFFNEVNLIRDIEHKNVVKLLGCSIEGPESLLIYEYLPNRSLDQIMFGKETVEVLTWKQRFQIVCGLAEGLAYLHGGSGAKIIHRDIKPSNILLDENLNPKIADFGLARGVSPDKSHLSTGIAGTLGYMAPEHLIRGQLTEKADVYAFGVLVVEIVCGKKNSIFTLASTSILHCVWKNYKAGNITASVDPALHGEFSLEEASKSLQAGLLCTQPSVGLRPSMSEVVKILTNKDKDYVIPSPKQPPFLNASVISSDDRTQTSMSSWFSNRQASVNSSFQSTRSSTSSKHSTMEDSFSSVGRFTASSSPETHRAAATGGPEPR